MMTLQFPTGRPKLLRRRSPARCLCAYQPKTITHRSEDAASPTRNLVCPPAVASRDRVPARATPSQAPDPYLSQCLKVRGHDRPTKWGRTTYTRHGCMPTKTSTAQGLGAAVEDTV